MIGIYKIENSVNNKIYVGQSKDIAARWVHHKSDLNSNCHSNEHLQHAWNKYGEESFKFSVICECDICDLDRLEQYYIQLYDSKNCGYNLDNGGQGIPGYKHSQEQINKMRRIQDPLIILQFDTSFNFLKRYIGGVSHIYKECGYTKECIRLRCEHKKSYLPYKDSYWVYEGEYLSPSFSWDKYLNGENIISVYKSNIQVKHKYLQFSKQKQLINVWDNVYDLRNAGYNTTKINKICKHEFKNKTYKSYIWTYDDYQWDDGYFDDVCSQELKESQIKKQTVDNKVSVKCFSLDYDFCQSFDSMSFAAKYYQVSVGNISRAIKYHRTCNNMYWERYDDMYYENINRNN